MTHPQCGGLYIFTIGRIVIFFSSASSKDLQHKRFLTNLIKLLYGGKLNWKFFKIDFDQVFCSWRVFEINDKFSKMLREKD